MLVRRLWLPIWMMNILIISSQLQIWIFFRLQFYIYAGFCFLHFDTEQEEFICSVQKWLNTFYKICILLYLLKITGIFYNVMDDAHDNFNWSHYKIFVRTWAYANLSSNKQTTRNQSVLYLSSYMQSKTYKRWQWKAFVT